MKRAAFLIFALVVFAAMAVAVLIRSMTGEDDVANGWGGGGVPVEVSPVETREFVDIVEALGTAGANEGVTITAKVSDTISRINFDSGDYVEEGRILVELASAEEAAGLNEARATLREAEREMTRIRDLTERGVAPQSRQDEVLAVLERARARVSQIEARVADHIIRAPFSGIIGLRHVSPGELVGPGDAIARLDDTSVIKLDFTVPERFLSVLAEGMQVEARTSASEQTFTGEIARIDSRVDPVTRAVTVRALIDNEDGELRPGQLMTVEVRRDERQRPAVPGSAVTRYGNEVFVFVLTQTERGTSVERRLIEPGIRINGMIEVLSGLEVGERIVSEGVHRVSEGMPVTVADEAPASPNGAGSATTSSGGVR